MQTLHSNALDWLNWKQSITEPNLNHAADWSFSLMLYPPPHLLKFLSVNAARNPSQQGGALQPAETDNGRSILLCQIPGSAVATYFPDGYLLPWGALWVQCRGNVFHHVSANACQLTLLFSSNKVLASLPASLPATSPWYYPKRNGDTVHPLPLSGMRRCVFSLSSPCLVFLLFLGSGGTIPALFPLSDLVLGLTRMSGCIICTGKKCQGCG